jgi:hemolysin D
MIAQATANAATKGTTKATVKAAPSVPLDALAHDFRADLLTIQQSPPAKWPRGLLLTVCALVGLLILWACFAKLDIIATAQGCLVPGSFTKVVQPAESGVVMDILVQDGQAVKAGQVLLRLDPALSKSELGGLTRDVVIKQLSLQRIEAELLDRPFTAPPSAPPDVVLQVQAQYRARRQSYQDTLAQETEALNKAKSDLAGAQQVLSKLVQTVPIFQQSAQAYAEMLKDGLVGEVIANEKKREYLERAQDLKAQESNVQSLQAVIAGSDKKLLSIRSNYRSQLENERIDTITQLNKSGQELDKSTIRSGLLEIKAPNDGIVKDLAVTSKGAVVQAGSLLMNIVPQNERLQAEVLLSNEDVGFVAQGQKAQIKIAAYPFQKYGLMDGKVLMLSADSADPKQQQQNQQPTLSYRALVSLDEQQLKNPNGEKLGLTAGMLVVAEIHQGKRTVLEYLLSPVMKVGAEAARER